jgi:hypothetical protein
MQRRYIQSYQETIQENELFVKRRGTTTKEGAGTEKKLLYIEEWKKREGVVGEMRGTLRKNKLAADMEVRRHHCKETIP